MCQQRNVMKKTKHGLQNTELDKYINEKLFNEDGLEKLPNFLFFLIQLNIANTFVKIPTV